MSDIGVLNGPALPGVLSVSTAVEVKVGASRQDDRRVVTIQPTDGDIYWGFDNTVSTTTGFLIRKWQLIQLEASDLLPIWVVAATGTVDVRIAEIG